MKATVAIIGLGSNLAHPRRQLARALLALARTPGTRLIATSRNYLSAPIGCATAQPDYVNAAAAVRTILAPLALLHRLQRIERRQLRRRPRDGSRNEARTLDLDLLLYGRRRLVLPQLTVPHPRMHERAFTLRPLLDIAPTATIPGHGPARRSCRALRDQRIVPTRTHFLR